MISVVLPYWRRSFALARSLALFEANYKGLDFEVVVVVDGDAEDEPRLDDYSFPVRLIALPQKDGPLNPCVPINRGVEAARGDVLVISNPEILHKMPVLPAMLNQLKVFGKNGYILAAASCPDEGAWHCHSTVTHRTRMPPGFGLHFCAMLYRDLWNLAGGFDPDYRAGAGYDDNDWAWRVYRAGGQCKIRDDLVVIHPKSGARIEWPFGAFERNRVLFESKWPCGC